MVIVFEIGFKFEDPAVGRSQHGENKLTYDKNWRLPQHAVVIRGRK